MVLVVYVMTLTKRMTVPSIMTFGTAIPQHVMERQHSPRVGQLILILKSQPTQAGLFPEQETSLAVAMMRADAAISPLD
jgi:hypothetical protein